MALRTVKDVLSEHMISRTVYEKFRSSVPSEPDLHHAVALFMSLNIVVPVNQIATDCSIMRNLLYEAKFVLNCLKQNHNQRRWMELPLISRMLGTRFNTYFLNQNEDMMMRRLVQTLDGAERIVFNDHLYGLFKDWEGARMMHAVMPVVPRQFAVLFHSSAAVLHDPAPSGLVMVDARSMFISILKDLPIRKRVIKDHFTQRWGDCIERVWFSRWRHVPKGRNLVYGRIVFKSSTYINLALDGQNFRKFWINGRQLWAAKYHGRSIN